MAEWWTSLSVIMKVLWGVTLAASLVFVIQSIMTFLGADADGSFDAPDGVDMPDSLDDSSLTDSGANLYTFRNLVIFILGFGWTTILLMESVQSTALLIIIALLVGLGLVTIVVLLFKWLNGMQQSGNINVYKSAVGCGGKVYLTVPAHREGEGKVQITINNAVREYNAVSDGDAIHTGTPITVIEVVDAQTLLVEPSNSIII